MSARFLVKVTTRLLTVTFAFLLLIPDLCLAGAGKSFNLPKKTVKNGIIAKHRLPLGGRIWVPPDTSSAIGSKSEAGPHHHRPLVPQ